MSTRKAREADEARRKGHHAHMKYVLGLNDGPHVRACQHCRRATLGRVCYWCGKRRGLW
ncbi:MAG: hypothetical protein HYR72_03695 [Deltaproteobacteria bacterium]|nr:hypothetical protein [Deltaproteobacteria bacterium]MBI3388708.1 hypothetical protein [Deltaproteobacteria bacterium]